MSTVAAVVLFVGVIAYAVFGGADFGAGFWDLTAGGAERGRRPRHLVDVTLAPVWEANHVWLIFCLVMLWTAFPTAFAAIMTTLYVPLGLAALGIVVARLGLRLPQGRRPHRPSQRVAGAAFAVVVGHHAVLPRRGRRAASPPAGCRPAATATRCTSWVNPTSLLGGVLAVLACAVPRGGVPRGGGPPARRRATSSGGSAAGRWPRPRSPASSSSPGIAVLHADAPRLFSELTSRGLPLVHGVRRSAGVAALVLLPRAAPARAAGCSPSAAVAAVVAGWGVAQYPYLLGDAPADRRSGGARATLWVLVVVAAVAVVLVVPVLRPAVRAAAARPARPGVSAVGGHCREPEVEAVRRSRQTQLVEGRRPQVVHKPAHVGQHRGDVVRGLLQQAVRGLGRHPGQVAGVGTTREGPGLGVVVAAGDLGVLPTAVEVTAYRIVSEALANVVRHGRAARAVVRREREPGDPAAADRLDAEHDPGRLHVLGEDQHRGPSVVGAKVARRPASSSRRRITSASTKVGGSATGTRRPYSVGVPTLGRRSTREWPWLNVQRRSSGSTPTTASATTGPKA